MIFSKSDDNNVFFISGQIDEKNSFEFIDNIINCEINRGSVVKVIINTDGGDISEALAIFDIIEYLKKKEIIVETIGLGKIMSAGLILIAAGTPGKRFATQNARFMFHEIWSEHTGGPYNEAKTEFKETKFIQEKYINILSKITGKEKSFFQKFLNKKSNYYFTPEVAVEWGLIDAII